MHNWLKQRAPWQIGLCVIGIWSLIAIVWVLLLVLLTPPNGSTGGLLMPEWITLLTAALLCNGCHMLGSYRC